MENNRKPFVSVVCYTSITVHRTDMDPLVIAVSVRTGIAVQPLKRSNVGLLYRQITYYVHMPTYNDIYVN